MLLRSVPLEARVDFMRRVLGPVLDLPPGKASDALATMLGFVMTEEGHIRPLAAGDRFGEAAHTLNLTARQRLRHVIVPGALVHAASPLWIALTPLSAAAGKSVATIESLSRNNSHPLQKAWIAHDVPQCGYCQSGQIMSAAALLNEHPRPTDQQIDEGMAGMDWSAIGLLVQHLSGIEEDKA